MKCVLCGEETSGTYNAYPLCRFHYENGEDLSMLEDAKETTNGR